MAALAHLQPMVIAKSHADVVRCSIDEARLALGFDIAAMLKNGFEPAIVEEHEAINGIIDSFLSNLVIREYLTTLTPREVYSASGVRLLPLEDIRGEIARGAAPGGFIFPHGYLVFATSTGGNTICLHAQGGVVWADHHSFTNHLITYKDRITGEWREVPFTPENIELATVKLSNDAPTFLADLLNDRLETELGSLD